VAKRRLDLKLKDWGRVVVAGTMALGVSAVTRVVPGKVGLPVAIAAGAVLWIVALRLKAALRQEDVSRFLSISGQFRAPLRPRWKRVLAWMAPSFPTA
jgi:hypothetical protein